MTVRTDRDGNYTLSDPFHTGFGRTMTLSVEAVDTDGSENGGEFASRRQEPVIVEEDSSAEKKYVGHCPDTVDFTLEEKAQSKPLIDIRVHCAEPVTARILGTGRFMCRTCDATQVLTENPWALCGPAIAGEQNIPFSFRSLTVEIERTGHRSAEARAPNIRHVRYGSIAALDEETGPFAEPIM